MFIRKGRRKRADGPSHTGGLRPTEGLRWVPTPYDGRSADGRRTWISGGTIPFAIGTETYYVEPLRLAELLHGLGITEGDQRDWIRDSRVSEWVKSQGIRRDPSLNP
jgi:hypothetical protein